MRPMIIRSSTTVVPVVVVLFFFATMTCGAEASYEQTQLAALRQDRPRLAKSLDARPEVRRWILERFRITEPPLIWESTRPVSGRKAEWDARDPTVTVLRIDGSPSGIDQLTNLLFELHNVQGYDVFDAIHEEAVRGELTPDEYATKMLEQEFRALLAARAFYREHLSDLSRTEEKEARSYYRLLHGTDSFEQHLKEGLDRGFDLRDHYRELYDSIVIPEREQRDDTSQGDPGR